MDARSVRVARGEPIGNRVAEGLVFGRKKKRSKRHLTERVFDRKTNICHMTPREFKWSTYNIIVPKRLLLYINSK